MFDTSADKQARLHFLYPLLGDRNVVTRALEVDCPGPDRPYGKVFVRTSERDAEHLLDLSGRKGGSGADEPSAEGDQLNVVLCKSLLEAGEDEFQIGITEDRPEQDMQKQP